MNFKLKSGLLADAFALKADHCLLLAALHTQDPLPAPAQQAHQALDWSAQAGELLAFYAPQGAGARRVWLAGAGDASPQAMQKTLDKALPALLSGSSQPQRVCIALGWQPDAATLVHLMQTLAHASYVYTSTTQKAKPRALRHITICVPQARALRAACAHAQALSAGMDLSREWANRPPNHATPTHLAQAAKALAHADDEAMRCTVLNERQVRDLDMGAFLSVARGSDEPLRFIVLEYRGAGKRDAPLLFVGKGITFDAGGISLKPGAGMDEMKFDMCGAASVLGLFEALRILRPRVNVVGLMPCCENLPSGHATKPGDVVRSKSGQTIEILNTDAEGRLILADALSYAANWKPRAVIDVATLTGNCVLALGHLRSGLFSPNDALAQALTRAAERSRDLCWRMPLDDAYGQGLKSRFADMANIASREAGSISAAKFLERFATDYPWAHLDIAGTAWLSGKQKSATARPLPLLLQFVLDMSAPDAPDFGAASSP